MKLLIPIFCLFFFSSPDISEIRKIYSEAANSKNDAEALLLKLSDVEDNDSNKILVAYKGAALALKGKFSSKIKDKKSNLIAGAKLVEAAVKCEPDNIEIRFIRLSIQENLPPIIHYRKNIKEDKDFLLSHYKAVRGELKVYIKNFILQSKSFSEQEKQVAK